MTPRAITGLGIVSSIGIGRQAFFEGLRADTPPASRDGQLEVPGFDATKYLGDKGLRALDRLTKMLIVSARLALHDAGLKQRGAWTSLSPEAVGIIVSNAYGSLEAITELDRVATLEDARYINPSRFPLTVANSAAGYASIWEELRALNVSVSDGNCGALDAAACADVFLDQARARALLVGGAEAMSEALLLGFQRIGAVEDGATLGEGAALVVMESLDSARQRRAEILAEVIGYGTSFAPPEREASLMYAAPIALEQAVTSALADAALSPGDVDLVVSGLSGLRAFDEAELFAISSALADTRERSADPDRPCVVAPKRAIGETLGAGAAMAMAAALGYLHGEVRSHVVRGILRTPPHTVLVTSLGYYGNASALVMRSPSM